MMETMATETETMPRPMGTKAMPMEGVYDGGASGAKGG